MINVISGFVMPRLISDQLGQAVLGIWDFSWSMISYVALLQLGIGGSINRYVAKYRSQGDFAGLNRSVSTITVFLRAIAGLAFLVTALMTFWVVPLFSASLGASVSDCQWSVFWLGVKLAMSMTLTMYGSVIVGCHRWDIHNTVSAISYAVSTVAMIVVLSLGGGLPALAFSFCLSEVVAEFVRRHLARKICPELKIDRKLATWSVFKEQARYSGKSILPKAADIVSNQTLSLLIAVFLGPASLAVFSRPRGLTTTLRTLAAKFGYILIPTASSLQAERNHAELSETLKSSPAGLSALTLPAIVVLALFGDDIMKYWMGSHYVSPGLAAVLAVGVYPVLVQEPVWGILSGLNMHGRVALAKMWAAVVSIVTLAIGLGWLHWGLMGAALCFTLPRIIVDGLVTPVFACRKLSVHPSTFYFLTFIKPALAVLPFAAGLLAARAVLPGAGSLALLLAGIGIAGTAFIYWKHLIPPGLRTSIVRRARRWVPNKRSNIC
jgi:O-antigen/teichoic acid export membrane protein